MLAKTFAELRHEQPKLRFMINQPTSRCQSVEKRAISRHWIVKIIFHARNAKKVDAVTQNRNIGNLEPKVQQFLLLGVHINIKLIQRSVHGFSDT